MTPHKSIKCSPRGLLSSVPATFYMGLAGKFQAAKHNSWGQRLSWRVGKQDRGGACCIHPVLCMVGIISHRLVFLDSVFHCHGGRREPRMGEPLA